MPLVKKLIRVGDATGLILDPAILRQVDIQPESDVENLRRGQDHRQSIVSVRE